MSDDEWLTGAEAARLYGEHLRHLRAKPSAAERECEQLRAEVLRLRQALDEAVDGMDDMIGYVPDYFREKWGHDDFLARGRAALARGGPNRKDEE